MTVTILHGDCLDVLPTLQPESVHAAITDPPYHLTSIVKRFGAENAAPAQHGKDGAFTRASRGFMGKQWDGGDVAFRPETWAAVLRVMKPGAFLVAFASTRGYHRMVCAIEDAGFVIHPMLGWVFGSGFPKATRYKLPGIDDWRYGLQALKPALEPICLAQKPMIGTGSENWARFGCGGVNIGAVRVQMSEAESDDINNAIYRGSPSSQSIGRFASEGMDKPMVAHPAGRWPPNLLHDGSPEVLAAFGVFGESKSGIDKGERGSGGIWQPSQGIPCGPQHGDSGTAARFFPALPPTEEELRFHYSGKADAEDRSGSKHPTVKPTALMRWLCKLVTPPGGTILDPFCGTGSTLVAADQLQFDAIGIEADPTYAADAKRKFVRDAGLFADLANSA